jgi:uncharacterized protein YukE
MSQPTYAYDRIRWSSIDENMTAANAKIRENLTTLEENINAHLAAWDDEARATYESRRKAWNAAAAQLPVRLDAVVVASGNIRDIYDRTTQHATDIMGGHH